MTFPERWIREFESERPFDYRIHVIKSLTYKEAISWGGFFSYKHQRNHVDGYDHFFNDIRPYDVEMAEETNKRLVKRGIEPFPNVYVWIEHENLYAFYDHIGYNRHTKKFER